MSIAKAMSKSILAGLMIVGIVSVAHAKKPKNPIKVNRSVTYFKESVGSTDIRKCPWNRNMIIEIANEADGRVEITDENLQKSQGRTLNLIVMSIQANGYDRINVANWIHLRGELKEGQNVIATFTAKTENVQISSGRKKTACEVLEKISEDLVEEIADWTKKPANAELGYRGYN